MSAQTAAERIAARRHLLAEAACIRTGTDKAKKELQQ